MADAKKEMDGFANPNYGYDERYPPVTSQIQGPPTEVIATCPPMADNEIGFSNKTIRNGFIKKVYFVLTLQLLVTIGIVCLFIFEETVKSFVQRSLALYLSAYGIFVVTYICLMCCRELRRKVPINYILLVIFTLSLSFMAGVISSFHSTEVVIGCLGICAICCLVISIFAAQTKIDLTPCYWVMCIVLLTVCLFGISFAIFWDRKMTAVYSGIAAIVFMVILAIDTQLIIGGNRKFVLSPEEYIAGAIILYVDIVEIFLLLLGVSRS